MHQTEHQLQQWPNLIVSTERHSSLVIRVVSLTVWSPPGLWHRLIELTIAVRQVVDCPEEGNHPVGVLTELGGC